MIRERCMCGATDCPSCGPAQGYEVVRQKTARGWRWVNPEDCTEEYEEIEPPDDYPPTDYRSGNFAD